MAFRKGAEGCPPRSTFPLTCRTRDSAWASFLQTTWQISRPSTFLTQCLLNPTPFKIMLGSTRPASRACSVRHTSSVLSLRPWPARGCCSVQRRRLSCQAVETEPAPLDSIALKTIEGSPITLSCCRDNAYNMICTLTCKSTKPHTLTGAVPDAHWLSSVAPKRLGRL